MIDTLETWRVAQTVLFVLLILTVAAIALAPSSEDRLPDRDDVRTWIADHEADR